jgi:hypothetical protein
MSIEKKLDAVFAHAGPNPVWRYIPKSYNGGTGWGVYDRKTARFVDDKIRGLSLEALRDEKLAQ